jgi:chemotaxis signal transduction protein
VIDAAGKSGSDGGVTVSEDDRQLECLTFLIGGQCLAFPAAVVKQVVSPGGVTALPFSPPYLEGLVSINDRVLPLINLAAVLFPESGPQSAAGLSELLVLDAARAPCAVRVDQVLGRTVVESAALRRVERDDETGECDSLLAEFIDNDTSVLLLNADSIAGLVVPQELPSGETGLLGRAAANSADQHDREVRQCLLVSVAAESYAIMLGDVLEVIDHVGCSAVPGAPAEVEGLALIRGELLLVLNLARLLGLPEQRAGEKLVVVSCGEERYGLRVDQVTDIASFDQQAFRPVEEQDGALAGVLILGEVLYGMLGINAILSGSRQRQYRRLLPAERSRQHIVESEIMLMLHVRVAEDDYAIPLHQVQKVAEYHAPDVIADDDDGTVTGVVNISGEVLPAVSISRKSGLALASDSGAWVVLRGRDGDIAVPVREANDIISVEVDRIDRLVSSGADMVTGIVNIDGRMISVVDAGRAVAGGHA